MIFYVVPDTIFSAFGCSINSRSASPNYGNSVKKDARRSEKSIKLHRAPKGVVAIIAHEKPNVTSACHHIKFAKLLKADLAHSGVDTP